MHFHCKEGQPILIVTRSEKTPSGRVTSNYCALTILACIRRPAVVRNKGKYCWLPGQVCRANSQDKILGHDQFSDITEIDEKFACMLAPVVVGWVVSLDIRVSVLSSILICVGMNSFQVDLHLVGNYPPTHTHTHNYTHLYVYTGWERYNVFVEMFNLSKF